MKLHYKLKKLYNRIYLIEIENMYDLAMLFCRVQEFYESPFKEIRNKNFTIIEFMALYSKKYGEGSFTYPNDWGGFNVPSHVIEKCYYEHALKDENEYDKIFKKIHMHICNEVHGAKYCLLGAKPKETETKNHELSHAFYYLYPEYKKQADKIINKLPKKIYNYAIETLNAMGYDKRVFKDEMQAYISNNDLILIYDLKLTSKTKSSLEKIKNELKELNKQFMI